MVKLARQQSIIMALTALALSQYVAAASQQQQQQQQQQLLLQQQHQQQQPAVEVEQALRAAAGAPEQEETYQRVYESFTKLVQSVSNNSLGNVRRLVSRLNNLVGTPAGTGTSTTVAPVQQQQQQQQESSKVQREQSVDERTDQILNRLDRVNNATDQHTLRQLNDDVARLVGSLNDSYLRNIRRVIERVNKVIGQPAVAQPAHQSGDRLNDPDQHIPGFPGFDEIIVAMDRMQKSLAHFVRSSTRLITAG